MNRKKIKYILDRITTQAIPPNFLITAFHELHLRKTFDMVGTRSNMQHADHNSNLHGRKSLRGIIYHVIGVRLYPTLGL